MLGHMRSLPFIGSLLAVCAHPDDESFGLRAALAAFTERQARAGVLCFTRGEASTLGTDAGDLERIRANELQSAAKVLRIDRVALLAYPDGALDEQPLPVLAGHVATLAEELQAETPACDGYRRHHRPPGPSACDTSRHCCGGAGWPPSACLGSSKRCGR